MHWECSIRVTDDHATGQRKDGREGDGAPERNWLSIRQIERKKEEKFSDLPYAHKERVIRCA